MHDFVIPELGKAVPYGVYDIADDAGWVGVGVDHDTGAFAVNATRSWWTQMGRARYPNAETLLITADGGGSNGSRVRSWKVELQKLQVTHGDGEPELVGERIRQFRKQRRNRSSLRPFDQGAGVGLE